MEQDDLKQEKTERTRRVFDLQTKQEIIIYASKHGRLGAVKKYGIAPATLGVWMKHHNDTQARPEIVTDPHADKLKRRVEELESGLKFIRDVIERLK